MKFFQVNEDDLAEMERTLPSLADLTMATLDNRQRVQWRRVQEILTRIRWNYGPPTDVKIIPADDDGVSPFGGMD